MLTYFAIAVASTLFGRAIAQIANCDTFVPDLPPGMVFCQNCAPGFLNVDGMECVPCEVDNCAVCHPVDTCTQCQHPYTLVNGECEFNVCGEPFQINFNNPCGPFCTFCPPDDQPFCRTCQVGYWNDNGYCKSCCTDGCATCQPPDGLVCTECIDTGMPAVNGTCMAP